MVLKPGRRLIVAPRGPTTGHPDLAPPPPAGPPSDDTQASRRTVHEQRPEQQPSYGRVIDSEREPRANSMRLLSLTAAIRVVGFPPSPMSVSRQHRAGSSTRAVGVLSQALPCFTIPSDPASIWISRSRIGSSALRAGTCGQCVPGTWRNLVPRWLSAPTTALVQRHRRRAHQPRAPAPGYGFEPDRQPGDSETTAVFSWSHPCLFLQRDTAAVVEIHDRHRVPRPAPATGHGQQQQWPFVHAPAPIRPLVRRYSHTSS
jgi:hypothetical protein